MTSVDANEVASEVGSLWVDKWCPKTLDEYVLNDELKTYFRNMIKTKTLQNFTMLGTQGSGKTTLSELKIATNLLLGKRVLYLVPTHALEHQVAKDLNRLWNNVVSDVIDKDNIKIVGDVIHLAKKLMK